MRLLLTFTILLNFYFSACACLEKPIPRAEADAITFRSLQRYCKNFNCNASEFVVARAVKDADVINSDEDLAWHYTYEAYENKRVKHVVIIMLDYCGGTEISSARYDGK